MKTQEMWKRFVQEKKKRKQRNAEEFREREADPECRTVKYFTIDKRIDDVKGEDQERILYIKENVKNF